MSVIDIICYCIAYYTGYHYYALSYCMIVHLSVHYTTDCSHGSEWWTGLDTLDIGGMAMLYYSYRGNNIGSCWYAQWDMRCNFKIVAIFAQISVGLYDTSRNPKYHGRTAVRQPWFWSNRFVAFLFFCRKNRSKTDDGWTMVWLNHVMVKPWYEYVDDVVASWLFASLHIWYDCPTMVKPCFFTTFEPWFSTSMLMTWLHRACFSMVQHGTAGTTMVRPR